MGDGGAATSCPPPGRKADETLPTPADAAAALDAARALKSDGNAAYARADDDAALAAWNEALEAVARAGGGREATALAVMLHANSSAAHLRASNPPAARAAATAALALDPAHVKALLRRAAAAEAGGDVVAAEADARAAVAAAPGDATAEATAARLAPLAEAEAEKLKAAAMEQLKGVGNALLGAFGLSLDSFVAERDEATGAFSVRMADRGGGGGGGASGGG